MTQHRSLVLALLLPLSSALLACDGGGGDIAIEDLGSEFADEFCESQTACGRFPDVASCKAAMNFSLEQLVADVEAGLVDYDGGKARECVDSFSANDCNLFGQMEENDACDATFTGSVALGGACFNSEVCAGDTSCDGEQSDTCTPGVCVAREPDVGEGQSCSESSCADELICNDSMICETRPALGESCASLFGCANGALCKLGEDSSPGTCVELPTTGNTCDPELGGEYLGGRFSCLLVSDYCDASDNTCKAKLPAGSDCSAASYGCVNYAQCIEGSCVASPGAGESCVVDGQPECLGTLNCTGGTCVPSLSEPICTL